MKSLSLSKPLVIMMVGLPGAGKSFFARQFSETFSAPVVSYDRLRFELFSEPNFSNDEQDILDRIAQYQIEELLKTKRTFLIDGGCGVKADRYRINQLVKESDYDTLLIWVQTDTATCKQRATKRSARRSDDKFNASLSDDQFDSFAKRFTPPSRENSVVISGKHTYPTQARAVLRKLAGPREAEAESAHREATEQTPSRPTNPKSSPTQQMRRSVPIR